jgi:two-component system sensor histidine kinase KdpD
MRNWARRDICGPALPRNLQQERRERLASFLGTGPRRAGSFRPAPYLGSAAAVLLALGCGYLIERYIGLQSVLLVFLTAILASAIAWGLLPSLFACVLSVLAFNFFLLPPLYTLTIADPDNAVALFFFFIVAVIVSHLSAAARTQIVVARRQARTNAALYDFSRKLAGLGALDDRLWAIAYQVSSMLNVATVLLMPGREGALELVCGYPPDDRLDAAGLAAAGLAWQGKAAVPAAGGASGHRLFLPLSTGSGAVGVLGIEREAGLPALSAGEHRLLLALADQTAVAIERVRLAARLAEARLAAETERLRAALLTSISHDLRTPLASILGTVSSLRGISRRYDAAQREELLATLQEETERLNRFVGNLLDLTRLEAGAIEPHAELFDIAEIVGAALNRASDVLAHHRVGVALTSGLPMLRVDGLLLEQALFNLLDNAAKYAPAGSRIEVHAGRDGADIVLQVCDEGPGIPPAELERVFDKFYRVQAQDRRRAGTGLGLAICRGFVEAQGGRIEAANRSDRDGAVLSVRLPVPEPAAPAAAAMAASDAGFG